MAKRVVKRINAALTAERKISADLTQELTARIADLEQEQIPKLRDQLLSALAAIEKHNEEAWPNCYQINVEDGLLHENDAQKPLVDALREARSAMTNVRYNKPRIGMERECQLIDDALAKVKQ